VDGLLRRAQQLMAEPLEPENDQGDENDEGGYGPAVVGQPGSPVEVVRGAERPYLPPPGQDFPIRETTAKWLGKGVFCAFAAVLACICVAHGFAMWTLSQPVAAGITGPELEALFRWRQQVADSANSFTQTIGTLLAGPFGVVLGFYFRDRGSSSGG